MSADRLREAASLMRARAEGATPGPWSEDGPWWHEPAEAVGLVSAHPGRMAVAIAPPLAFVTADDDRRDPTMQHIASWHPAVALAVADWLDREVAWAEIGAANSPMPEALAVADAYLGDPS